MQHEIRQSRRGYAGSRGNARQIKGTMIVEQVARRIQASRLHCAPPSAVGYRMSDGINRSQIGFENIKPQCDLGLIGLS